MEVKGTRLLITWLGFIAMPVFGGERIVDVEISSSSPIRRTGAPFPVEVTLQRLRPGATSGRLEMVFLDGGDTLSRFQTRELSFRAHKQMYRLLVPPLANDLGSAELTVKLRFVTSGLTHDLGEHFLYTDLRYGYTHLLGVCIPEQSSTAFMPFLQAMRPKPIKRHNHRINVKSFLAYRAAHEWPAHPLGYCAYDALIFESGSILELNRAQRLALVKWVRAGGRLLVFTRTDFGTKVTNYLRNFSRPASEPQRDTADANGATVDSLTTGNERVHLIPAGLGRLVALRRLPDRDELETQPYRKAFAHLWEMRERITKNDEIFARQGESGIVVSPRRSQLFGKFLLERELFQHLMPQDIQPIPISVITVLFLFFVLLVGPVDYIFLGRLKRRSLTWIFFPLISVAITLCTLELTEYYLGEGVGDPGIEFIDLDQRGHAVRRNRFGVHFGPSAKPVVSAHVDEVLLSISEKVGSRSGASGVISASYLGEFPTNYSVSYPVRKWTPVLTRNFEIEPEVSVPELNWNTSMKREPWSAKYRKEFSREFMGGRSFAGAVYLFFRDRLYVLHEPGAESLQGFLEALTPALFCSADKPSLIVSHEAPLSFNLGDLRMVANNKREFILVVVQWTGNDIFVYRRKYSIR